MDWTRSMKQTFEYYEVNPVSWQNRKKLTNVKSCTIKYDRSKDTLASATLEMENDVGEIYIRVYLVAEQDRITERFCLGTFLVQTPSKSFDGMANSVSLDAYSPLLELKDIKVPIGYYIKKTEIVDGKEVGFNILEIASNIAEEKCRAPVIGTTGPNMLQSDFTAETDEDWLSYLKNLIAIEDYEFSLDEMGRITFSPHQDAKALRPIWTYNDDNTSSILYPDISLDHDLYGIPNVVEVLYTGNNHWVYSRIENDDPSSPTSLISRGREITYRETNPILVNNPSQAMVDMYAETLLRKKSTLEYKISYTHGYCPVRIGDCVRLNYRRAGYNDIRARVETQSIKCEPGCPVQETAVFTKELWEE